LWPFWIFTAIWYLLWLTDNFVVIWYILFPFWCIVARKIWQPCNADCLEKYLLTSCFWQRESPSKWSCPISETFKQSNQGCQIFLGATYQNWST
jgi:hypothetical protein